MTEILLVKTPAEGWAVWCFSEDGNYDERLREWRERFEAMGLSTMTVWE